MLGSCLKIYPRFFIVYLPPKKTPGRKTNANTFNNAILNMYLYNFQNAPQVDLSFLTTALFLRAPVVENGHNILLSLQFSFSTNKIQVFFISVYNKGSKIYSHNQQSLVFLHCWFISANNNVVSNLSFLISKPKKLNRSPFPKVINL